MRLDFDRDGKLEVRGLPVCPVGRIAHATVDQARRECAGAIVGTGHVGAIFDLFGVPVRARVKATLFNGPPKGGNPTVIGHTYTTLPTTRTYTVVIPIKPMKRGPYSYRATFDVPNSPPTASSPTSTAGSAVATTTRAGSTATSTPAAPPESSAPTATSSSPTARSWTARWKSPARPIPLVPAPALATFLYLPDPGPLAQLVRAGAS